MRWPCGRSPSVYEVGNEGMKNGDLNEARNKSMCWGIYPGDVVNIFSIEIVR